MTCPSFPSPIVCCTANVLLIVISKTGPPDKPIDIRPPLKPRTSSRADDRTETRPLLGLEAHVVHVTGRAEGVDEVRAVGVGCCAAGWFLGL